MVPEGKTIPGATAASLVLNNVQPSDTGRYFVRVSNTAGAASSGNAQLTVTGPLTIVSATPNQEVNLGGSVFFSVTAIGMPPLTYQWLYNGSAPVTVRDRTGAEQSRTATLTVRVPPQIVTQPQSTDVAPAASVTFTVTASGTAPLSYQWLRSGQDLAGAIGPSLSLGSVAATDAEVYSVRVSNAAGSVVSAGATLLIGSPPMIVPLPLVEWKVDEGENFTLDAAAAGTQPFTYQWLHDEVPISTATDRRLTLTNVRVSDSGNYALIVRNKYGEVKTTYAVLKVIPNEPSSLRDGIPDPWRQQFFGSGFATDSRALAIADLDADGANNFQEFLAGTNPLDAKSVKRVPLALSTWAGSESGSRDGYRTEAQFNSIGELVRDAQGRIWLAEFDLVGFDQPGTGLHRIRVIDQNGMVSTFAGAEPGEVDGPANTARFSGCAGIALDSKGQLLVVDRTGHRIRRVDPSGSVTTVAGSTRGFRDGNGLQAQFNVPIGIAVDGDDNIFVADWFNLRVRKISPQGVVSTYSGGVRGNQNGPRLEARYDGPVDVALDKSGNLFVSDWANGQIRKIDATGQVTTFVSGVSFTEEIDVDTEGNLYVVVHGLNQFRKYGPAGNLIWTIATPAGYADGPIAQARLDRVSGVLTLPDGNLWVSNGPRIRFITIGVPPLVEINPPSMEWGNNTPGESLAVTLRTAVTNGVIRSTLNGAEPTAASPSYAQPIRLLHSATIRARVFINNSPVSDIVEAKYPRRWPVASAGDPSLVETLAGSDVAGAATLNQPNGGSVGPDGGVYVADTGNHRIPRVDPITGRFAVIAGTGTAGFADGPGASAQFSTPLGVFAASNGEIFVADTENNRIRKIGHDTARTVSTVAGSGQRGYVDGLASAAQFDFPNDLVADSAGNLFVTEFNNHTIRKITPQGAVSTFAGSGRRGFDDGIGTGAGFNQPAGIALDPLGNFFVTEWSSHRIRKITASAQVTLWVGGIFPGFVDGSTSEASFNQPDGIAVDAAGNLYVTEYGNHAIRRITPDGRVTKIAGTGQSGFADGNGAAAKFSGPGGIGVDANGDLFVTDTGNNRVRKITLLRPEIVSGPQSQSVAQDGNASFTVNARGFEPLSFQWRFNGVDIAGATEATLNLPNVQGAQAGNYTVRVSNVVGSVTSAPGALTVWPAPVPPFVQRKLPPGYTPGFKFTVTLESKPPASVSAYAVEEFPPNGWIVGAVNGGSYDAANKKVKFGPFFDATERMLTYEVTPPASDAGSKEFTGSVSVDGASVAIGGKARLDGSQNLHPADTNPANSRLTIDEITAYAAAWRKGTAWPVAPSPIPIDYLTRAGTLWKNGENYVFDPSVSSAPLWWVNAPRAAGLQSVDPASAGASPNSATRQLPEKFSFDVAFTVRINVAPAASVSAYALEERVPAGWLAASLSHSGEFDAVRGIARFGPFFDNTPREITYQATPKGTSAGVVAAFDGVASFDGANAAMGGQAQMALLIRALALRPSADGKFELSLLGQPGVRYEIRASSNLRDWITLTTATHQNGVLTFSDPAVFSESQRFYFPVLVTP